jgi:hypothetical protein
MIRDWSRWTPLTGVVAALFGVAGAAFEITVNPPASAASGKAVIAFYSANQTGQRAATILLAFAFIFVVFFAGSLRHYLRSTPAGESLASIALAGAAVLAVGQLVGGGLTWGLTDSPGTLDPAAAQALNVLGVGMVLIPTAGLFIFGISIGLAIVRGAELPKWLGWVAIAIGIVVVTPLEGFSYLALVIWMVIVSILIWIRAGQARHDPARSVASAGGVSGS